MTAIAVALPGVDPVTTLLEMIPLISLYLISVALSGLLRAPLATRNRDRDRMTELSADWVLPVDGPPIENGRVRFEDGVIVDVSPGRAARHFEDVRDPPRLRERPFAPRILTVRRVRRRPAVRPVDRVARGAEEPARRRRDARARAAGRARLAALRDHDHCRLQLLRRGGDGRRRARPTRDRLHRGVRARTDRCRTAVHRQARAGRGERARPDRHLASRSVHVLGRGLPVVPRPGHPRRDASRGVGARERVARARHRPAAGDRTDARPAERQAVGRDARARARARASLRPTASRSTTRRSPCSPNATSRSLTARARTPCSAAASPRSRRCGAAGRPGWARHRLAGVRAVVRRVRGDARRRLRRAGDGRSGPRRSLLPTRSGSRRSMLLERCESTTRWVP